jgi:hypothetical protein
MGFDIYSDSGKENDMLIVNFHNTEPECGGQRGV